MAINFNSALGIHEQAMAVRNKRAEIIANNLANSDTPNYKARDIDFREVLSDQVKSGQLERVNMATTHAGHQQLNNKQYFGSELLFRTPMQPSIDGNTVEENVEHAEFMENAIAFQASFTFLNSKFKGLMSAIRGE